MNDAFKEAMMSYYDARAPEYDEIYVGKGPVSIPDPALYKDEAEVTARIVSTFGTGHLVDIACGTGYWLPYYARNCSKITLVDQSGKMLSECRRRVEELGMREKCDPIQSDFFKASFKNTLFDSALVGFLLSHLSSEKEETFFRKLLRILNPGSRLMVIDSAWSKRRQQYRQKEGVQERALDDGRIFSIYKRYFSKSDIEGTLSRHHFRLDSYWEGDAWFVAICNKTGRNTT